MKQNDDYRAGYQRGYDDGRRRPLEIGDNLRIVLIMLGLGILLMFDKC